MTRPPSKYFGLKSSTDLYLKLLYDIERLRAGGGTKAVQYAAFDAAVTGAHILDWVLNELTPEAYLRLTGLRKGKKPPKDDPGAIMRFIERNGEKMDGLDVCRQIANAVKHMKISMGRVMKGMAIGSTVKLEWTDKGSRTPTRLRTSISNLTAKRSISLSYSRRRPISGASFSWRKAFGSSSRQRIKV